MNYKEQLIIQLDNKFAEIYNSYNRFLLEYQLREQQAITFRDSGYVGTPPRQVQAFAARANKTPQEATGIILYQATSMRAMLEELGDLRMRKFELLTATTDEELHTVYTSIVSAVELLKQQLP